MYSATDILQKSTIFILCNRIKFSKICGREVRKMKFCDKLSKLRKNNNMSQEQLADKLGVSRQAVSKWERAEASPDTDNLICLAKIYGISLDELLADDESIDDIRRNVKEQQKEKGFEFKVYTEDTLEKMGII